MQQNPLPFVPRMPVSQVYANHLTPFRPVSPIYTSSTYIAPALYQQPWANNTIGYSFSRSTSNTIPDTETVKTQLTTKQGAIAGIKSGLLCSAIAALPLFGLEHFLGRMMIKKNKIEDYHQSGFDLRNANLAGENLLANVAQFIEPRLYLKSERTGSPKELIWTRKLISQYKIPASIASTTAIFAVAGAGLGAWLISRTRNRLIEINKVKQQQSNGTFKPVPLNILHRLGLSEKPITNPDQSYQDLLQNHLSKANAFKQAVIAVLLCKTSPAVVSSIFPFGIYYALKAMGKAQFCDRTLEKYSIKFSQLVISTFHPVLLANMAALPLIGGMIAVQTVPWMRKQLGLKNS